MTYRLVRSRRSTVSLTVTREGEVVVRAPLRMPRQAIDAFVASKTQWLARQMARQQALREAHPPLTEEEKEALRQRAKAYLPGRVAHYAPLVGVTPTALHITSARTRFGSCSGKNSISFSLYLMQYPPEAIDYVVVHELCHIRHHDHSAAFYALVASVLPDYRQRQALLRQ